MNCVFGEVQDRRREVVVGGEIVGEWYADLGFMKNFWDGVRDVFGYC